MLELVFLEQISFYLYLQLFIYYLATLYQLQGSVASSENNYVQQAGKDEITAAVAHFKTPSRYSPRITVKAAELLNQNRRSLGHIRSRHVQQARPSDKDKFASRMRHAEAVRIFASCSRGSGFNSRIDPVFHILR